MRRCVEASLPSSASFAFIVDWTEKGLMRSGQSVDQSETMGET